LKTRSTNTEIHRHRFLFRSLCLCAYLYIDYFVVYDLGSPASYVVHFAYPSDLTDCLELFRYTFLRCHLHCEPFKYLRCLPVNVSKITVQLAVGEQIVVAYPVILLQIPQMPLSPYTDVGLMLYPPFVRQYISLTTKRRFFRLTVKQLHSLDSF